MRPTVYLPLADLCPTGSRRPSTRSAARFSAGRIATRRLWIERQGRYVGKKEHRDQTVAGNSEERRIA